MRSKWLLVVVFGLLALTTALLALGQEMMDLTGTEWQLVAIDGQDVAAGVTTTLTFGEDGRAGGSGGCNRYSANYVIDGESLSFGPAVSTKMACSEPNMQQESAYFAALESASSYALTEQQLIIQFGEGQQLVFALAPAAHNG